MKLKNRQDAYQSPWQLPELRLPEYLLAAAASRLSVGISAFRFCRFHVPADTSRS